MNIIVAFIGALCVATIFGCGCYFIYHRFIKRENRNARKSR